MSRSAISTDVVMQHLESHLRSEAKGNSSFYFKKKLFSMKNMANMNPKHLVCSFISNIL